MGGKRGIALVTCQSARLPPRLLRARWCPAPLGHSQRQRSRPRCPPPPPPSPPPRSSSSSSNEILRSALRPAGTPVLAEERDLPCHHAAREEARPRVACKKYGWSPCFCPTR